jgi:ABC-type transporter Mla MlaB component
MDTLRLPAELSIYTAASLHPQWLAWVSQVPEEGGDVCVDGSPVDVVDAAGVQLLLALQHSLTVRGCMLKIGEPSHPLQQACAALGLATWLNERQALPCQETP